MLTVKNLNKVEPIPNEVVNYFNVKNRMEKAVKLIDNITKIELNEFEVRSQTNSNILYRVDILNNTCTCLDYIHRNILCKHLQACKLYENGKKEENVVFIG